MPAPRKHVSTPSTNVFFERSNRAILDEFIRKVFREKFYESLDALQVDLDAWLKFHSKERLHRDQRNMGKAADQDG